MGARPLTLVGGGGASLLFPIRTEEVLTVNGENGTPLVTLRSDGELVYHPGYEADEAARAFWSAIAKHLPRYFCSNCGDVMGGRPPGRGEGGA